MKKSYPFNVLSERKCMNCGKLLKKRMVEEHKAKICWKCLKLFMRKYGVGRRRTLTRLGI